MKVKSFVATFAWLLIFLLCCGNAASKEDPYKESKDVQVLLKSGISSRQSFKSKTRFLSLELLMGCKITEVDDGTDS